MAGGLVHGHARELLWLLAIGVDVLGGIVGFATPGLGRSRTSDWTIEGGHFAERCQAFILIALGESIVIIGANLSVVKHVTATSIAAFTVAFASSGALWWLYFDRSADASAEVIERSQDPGRLGRTAYHLIHPVMVAGIIVAAAGDQSPSPPARPRWWRSWPPPTDARIPVMVRRRAASQPPDRASPCRRASPGPGPGPNHSAGG